MISVNVYNAEGKQTGSVDVDPALFGGSVRWKTLHAVVVALQSNQRQGNASARSRGQISYSNKKPWRQKGTGRARPGRRSSPLWRHGGVVFPPKSRDWTVDVPRKKRRVALDSALLGKLQDGQVLVVDGFSLDSPRTSRVATLLGALGASRTVALVGEGNDKNLYLSTRNIEGGAYHPVADLNALVVSRARHLVLTRAALDWLVSQRKENAK